MSLNKYERADSTDVEEEPTFVVKDVSFAALKKQKKIENDKSGSSSRSKKCSLICLSATSLAFAVFTVVVCYVLLKEDVQTERARVR